MRTLETALLPVDSCGVKLAWQLTQRAPQLPCIANVSFGCSANRGEIWTTCSGRFRMGTEPASEMACGYHVRDRKPFFCHGVDGCSRRPSEAPPPPARPPEAMTSTRKPPCTSGGQLVEPGGIWRAQTPEELAATFVPPSVTTTDAALARLAHNERGASASTSSGSASFVGSWGHLVDWDALTEETRCCDFSALDPCNVVHPRHNLGGDAHLTFEPHACSLPLPASTRVALPSRVRFVGDSVSRQHFVAFGRYTRASTCVFRCFAQRAGSVTTWARAPSLLTQAGYAPDVADRAVAWLRAHQGARNVSSCGGRPQCAAFEFCEDDDVSYGRLDKLPPPSDEAVVGAAMHLLVYGHTTRGPLGPNDYLVANWGMHGRESRAAWPAVMRWWRKQAARGRAPRLIHREQAPTHWHDNAKPRFQKATRRCAKLATRCQPPAVPQDTFATAAQAAGLPIDDRRIAVLPISEPSKARNDEHGLFHYWAGPALANRSWVSKQGGWYLADCVHWCLQSSTLRFWSAATLALMQAMATR